MPNSFLRWIRAYRGSTVHRIRHSGDEDNSAWSGAQGVFNIPDLGGQSDRSYSDTGQWNAAGKRGIRADPLILSPILFLLVLELFFCCQC